MEGGHYIYIYIFLPILWLTHSFYFLLFLFKPDLTNVQIKKWSRAGKLDHIYIHNNIAE